MNYNFPIIKHLNDVLPYIKDRSEFIVAERDFGYVVNYTHVSNDTFPELQGPNDPLAILRECRGIIFDKDGKIMSRPFHKFFNLNERAETSIDELRRAMAFPHVILEKLDGSMVRPIWYPDGSFRLGTKMGITDVAMQAEVWLTQHPNYSQFINDMKQINETPIFEWCSKKNKIVLDYPEDRLVLLAVRNNVLGGYYRYPLLKEFAQDYNLDLVQQYEGNIATVESLIQNIRDSEKLEGWVIRFQDSQMMKIKADWYVALHKTKDQIREEKNVLELIVNDQLDDLLPLLDEADKQKVLAYRDQVWEKIEYVSGLFNTFQNHAVANNIDRKTFALNYAPKTRVPSIAFDIYGRKYDNSKDAIVAYIKKNCGSRKSLEKVHHLLGKLNYEEAMDE